MNTDDIQKVTDNLKNSYPELFDDPTTENKLNFAITRAYLKCKQYKSKVSDDELIMLVTLYTAYLVKNSQSDSGQVSSAKADIFQANFYRSNDNSNAYLAEFNDLLDSLGLNDSSWKIKFL